MDPKWCAWGQAEHSAEAMLEQAPISPCDFRRPMQVEMWVGVRGEGIHLEIDPERGEPCWDNLLTSHLPLHIFLASNMCCVNFWRKWLILKYNRTEIHLADLRKGVQTPLFDDLAWFPVNAADASALLWMGKDEAGSGSRSTEHDAQKQLSSLANIVLAEPWMPWPKSWMICTTSHTLPHPATQAAMSTGEWEMVMESVWPESYQLPCCLPSLWSDFSEWEKNRKSSPAFVFIFLI